MRWVRDVLRAAAVAIAVVAAIDPSIERDVQRREPLHLVAMDDAGLVHAVRLRARLADDVETTTARYDGASAAAACPSTGGCVLFSSGDAPTRVTAGARVLGGVKIAAGEDARDDGADPVIARVDTPRFIHRDASATLRVQTHRPVPRIDIFDGDTLVGSTEPKDSTTVDVPWVPLAEGARVLRVVADNDVADVGLMVSAAPVDVLFYEPQVTWLGTFVRRALEDDARFAIRGRARVAPSISVSRGDGGLSAAAVSDVGMIVITSPEVLTGADVDLLERFVTLRGGSLIVVTDRRPTGAAERLLPRVAAERHEPQPQSAGPLRATEWLVFEPATGVSPLASIGQQAVAVSRVVGRGRIIVSGALDAWRFREASDQFNTFWTSIAWDAATTAGPRLRVEADPVVVRPGEEVNVAAEMQTLADPPGELTVSAQVDCSGRRQALRLWPGARRGTFAGTFRPDREGECGITVTTADASGSAQVTIRDELHRLSQPEARLDAVIAAHGGLLVGTDADDALLARIRAELTSRSERQSWWPMRSIYWLIPFVACLGGEWWLRRRTGLS